MEKKYPPPEKKYPLLLGTRVTRTIGKKVFVGTLTHERTVDGMRGFHIDIDGEPALFVQFFPESIIRQQWEVI